VEEEEEEVAEEEAEDASQEEEEEEITEETAVEITEEEITEETIAEEIVLVTLPIKKEEPDKHQSSPEQTPNHALKTLSMFPTFHSISMIMILNKSSANST